MSDTDAATKLLLDKAAQLRAEIASMEGKTVKQVNQEAQEKKQGEADRLKVQKEENVARMAERQARAPSDQGRSFVQLPNTVDDMIRQAARAVERAYKDGKKRQTVRFHLVSYEDDSSANSNKYQNGNNYNVLEENQWPGGAQQMYREAGKPLTSALLKEVRVEPTKENLAPTIKEQDIWDFDGSALHTAEASAGPSGDIQALVFPNTDVKYIRDIDEISNVMGKDRLFLLVNPSWRNLDSWGYNILAPNAKEKAQKVIFDADQGGYDETYINQVFQVRGEKCIAIKAYPYDWQIFAMREDDDYPNTEYAIRLGGSSSKELTSALVTKLLNERPEFKETKTMRQFKKL